MSEHNISFYKRSELICTWQKKGKVIWVQGGINSDFIVVNVQRVSLSEPAVG